MSLIDELKQAIKELTERRDLMVEELNTGITNMTKILETVQNIEEAGRIAMRDVFANLKFTSHVVQPTPLTTEEKDSLTEDDVDFDTPPTYVTAEKDKKAQIEVIVERSREGLKDNLKTNLPETSAKPYTMSDYYKNVLESKNSPYKKVEDVWVKERPGGVTVIRLVEGVYTESRYKTGEVYHTKNKVIKEQPKPTPPVNYEWE